ncbi:MAG: HlyC/CorC family transporter [Synechococcales cyanobacterium K44_A2020_017]|nr:HlyC/CorC family transporter [Synechococcales cyanobacterium K32_A2020_035]MBF2093268.1 HlyC/CorC family transporter [Synechococcales cyanobacterium K44_A2020_017]
MSSITLELLIILVLVLANGLFAMSEIAVVSSRKARLQEMSDKGDLKARAALELANSPNRFLSTVQVGITLIGILAGAFGGATLSQSLAIYLKRVPIALISESSDAIALVVVVLSITYLSLILGELVPKRLALNHPEKIAASVAVPMRFLSVMTAPVVHLLTTSTEWVLKVLGIEANPNEPLVTEDEIKVLIRQGTEAGMFEMAEQDMLERVFRLSDQTVSALMTPRPDILWLDLNDTIDMNRQKLIRSNHTRFPVCQNSLDNMLGVVSVTDVLARSLTEQAIDFTALLQQPLFIPENTRALKVLEFFKQSGTHIALVVDEYGVIQGLVTLNDVMEVIIGDIPFSDQPQEQPAIQREDGSWLVDGMLPIDRFKTLFKVRDLPGEQWGNYQTLGGFVITYLGRIPAAADHFYWNGFRFEVMDMDGNRVDKMLVMPPTS